MSGELAMTVEAPGPPAYGNRRASLLATVSRENDRHHYPTERETIRRDDPDTELAARYVQQRHEILDLLAGSRLIEHTYSGDGERRLRVTERGRRVLQKWRRRPSGPKN